MQPPAASREVEGERLKKKILDLDHSGSSLRTAVYLRGPANLDGFRPAGPCLYRRVLVPVQVNGAVLPAWLYAGEYPLSRRLTPLGGSRWTR
jgi:hypothetical protein